MRVESLLASAPVTAYSRLCVQKIGRDKFLVAHEEEGQTNGMYTCMKFLQRDRAVVQFRQAQLSEDLNRHLCNDENLTLNGWIIIDYKAIQGRREECSLSGGFNMQVYDKGANRGVCDGYTGETRLESECLPGEGMIFDFRQASCVPDGLLMYPEQRTQCVVNWTVGHFNFILLSDSNRKFLWLLRYPNVGMFGVTMQAILMKDLYATKETSIKATSNYLTLTMSSQSPKTLDSLCYDDYEICSVLSDPCSYSEEIARTCAKTCGFCTDSRPNACQLNIPNPGTWTDSLSRKSRPDAAVNSTAISIRKSETLHCIDWSDKSGSGKAKTKVSAISDNDDNKFSEQMLVTVTDNGCRPRFTCAKVTQMTQVIFLQLSQTRLWPLVQTKADPYDCSEFRYVSNVAEDSNPYRSNHTNMLVPSNASTVRCDLSDVHKFAITFQNQVQCSGQLYQNTARTNFQLYFHCETKALRDTYDCIEFSPFIPTSDLLLVTKTSASPPHYHCWLFPQDHNGTIFLIESEHCNVASVKKIKDGTLEPFAELKVFDDDHTSTAKPRTTTSKGSVIIDAITSTTATTTSSPEMTSPDGTWNTTSTENNSTESGTRDSGVSTSVGAATALMSLLLIVSATLCKCC